MRGNYIVDLCCGSCKDANKVTECVKCDVGRPNFSNVMAEIKAESEILYERDRQTIIQGYEEAKKTA